MRQAIHHIEQQLSGYFKQHIEITNARQVFGGDINQTFELQTNLGSFFLKQHDDRLADMFEKEFAGLKLLGDSKTVRVPTPILHGNFENNIFLITEFITTNNPAKNFWKTFAEQLADLHRHSNDQFGLQEDNYIGSLPQQNTFCKTWTEFYASYRIMPLMQKAVAQNKCSLQDVTLAEKLCDRLDDLFPKERASLIHGDLWSGNFMSDQIGAPNIFDPAVYYGNREMDIAMSLLFGGFDKSFYDHYTEAFPLQPGWQDRVQLCQLYPLLVHLILFGGHYYNSAMSIVKRHT